MKVFVAIGPLPEEGGEKVWGEALPAILREEAQPPVEGLTLRYADGRHGTTLNASDDQLDPGRSNRTANH